MTRTLWPIIDILCRLGCLLKRTMSPFMRCLSTTSPGSSSAATALRSVLNLRSILMPCLFLYTCVAPGHLKGPFSTSLLSSSMLYLVTTTGTVSILAISSGTPTSFMLIIGSGEITVLAE